MSCNLKLVSLARLSLGEERVSSNSYTYTTGVCTYSGPGQFQFQSSAGDLGPVVGVGGFRVGSVG